MTISFVCPLFTWLACLRLAKLWQSIKLHKLILLLDYVPDCVETGARAVQCVARCSLLLLALIPNAKSAGFTLNCFKACQHVRLAHLINHLPFRKSCSCPGTGFICWVTVWGRMWPGLPETSQSVKSAGSQVRTWSVICSQYMLIQQCEHKCISLESGSLSILFSISSIQSDNKPAPLSILIIIHD